MICGLGLLLLAAAPSGSVQADRIEVDLKTGHVRAAGTVTADVDGVHVHADEVFFDGERLQVRRGRVEPCVCPEVTWSVSAPRATATSTGVSATWAWVRVGSVPVLPMPYVHVPLGRRRTGLLTPDLRFTDPLGLHVETPLFITLGRSHDATLAPSVATSRGPAFDAQFRGRPAQTAAYAVDGTVFWDFGESGSDGDLRWGSGGPLIRWNARGEGDGTWRSGAFGARVDLVGDLAWRYDTAETFDARQAEWTRTRAAVGLATGRLRWVVAAGWNQDLRTQSYAQVPLDPVAAREVSPFTNGAPVRAVEVQVHLPPVDLVGGTWADGTMRVDLYSSSDARADFRPAWSGAWSWRGWTLDGEIAARATGWVGTRDGARLAGVVQGGLGWEGVRSWGQGWHRVRPSVRALWIPDVARTGEALPIPDEVQRLGPASQLRFDLSTDWRGARTQVTAHTDWGWDFGQAGVEGLGSAPWSLGIEGRTSAGRWSFGGSMSAAFEFATEPLRQARARVYASTSRVRLEAAYGHLASRLSGVSIAGPEELVPSANEDRSGYVPFDAFYDAADPRGSSPLSRLEGLRLGASVQPLNRWRLAADLGLAFDPADRLDTAYGIEDGLPVRDLAFRSDWTGACGCWALGTWVRWARDRDLPSVGASVRLEGLGSGRARREEEVVASGL